jgi:outer membrane lipopolysaccharide assembly protein LptE/RlpB
MAYEDFPTLSAAVVSVQYPEATYTQPDLQIEFENAWEEVRAITSRGRLTECVVTFRVNNADRNLILDFLTQRKVRVEPFYFDHPHWGRDLVRLTDNKITVKTLVDGAAEQWFEIELRLKEVF